MIAAGLGKDMQSLLSTFKAQPSTPVPNPGSILTDADSVPTVDRPEN